MSPVAIVTGGSSGIGLALVNHLVSLGWKVVIADINSPKSHIPETKFIHTDISSWDQQAAMFEEAYNWGKRLDFVALNAGVDDRDDIFNSLSGDIQKPPQEPNTKAFTVNISGTYYGIKLAAHYMTVPSEKAGKPKTGGKIVITASGGGIFPLPPIPQYTAAKHALVGLTRALAGAGSAAKANVRINAVCPAIVDTPGLPTGVAASLPEGQITPVATIIRCFDALANFDEVGKEDWVEQGRMGETLEGNVDELIWHYPPTRDTGDTGQYDRKKGIMIVAQAYEEKKRRAIASQNED